MSKPTQFQSKEEVSQFLADLRGMLEDPRLLHLAEVADSKTGQEGTPQILASTAELFGKMAQAL